jgi:hypothetical protein
MTEARMRKARRLHDVQKGLQRLEEDRIALVQNRRAELASLREELIGALAAEGGLQDLLVPLIVRRLKSVSEESTQLAAELERRYQALRAIASRTKVAERLSQTCEQQHARAVAEKELRDIIERITQSEHASLP